MVSDDPHVVEFDLNPASGPGTADGSFELRIDGTPQATLTGLDNAHNAQPPESARPGPGPHARGVTRHPSLPPIERQVEIPLPPALDTERRPPGRGRGARGRGMPAAEAARPALAAERGGTLDVDGARRVRAGAAV
jgi:hypothetical protein